MDINVNIKKNLQIRSFYLFFIIHSIQIGIGLLGLPRLVALESHHDPWLSLLIAFVYIVVVLTVMLYILKQYDHADIYGIQVDIFGKWLGKLLGTVYIIYFAITLFSVLITYIEIVRVFIFPDISNFTLGILLISLVVYSVLGGLPVIVGICTLVTFFTVLIMLLLIEPATQLDFTHFQPVFVTPLPELLKGALVASYSFVGFEILFVIYPFIRNKEKVKLPIFLGVSFSTLIALITTIIAIGYFSFIEIERREWIILNLFKIQSFAFIERFDFIVVSSWMIVILPNMILLMWGVTYGIKRLYSVPQKGTLYGLAVLLLIACTFFDNHFFVKDAIDFTSRFGLWLVYIYPFILLPFVIIKQKIGKKGRG